MTRVLFVCYGNICRSPMAEFVFKDLVEKHGLAKEFLIESAATSSEEIGNPVYPGTRKKLQEHGISCAGKHAVQLKKSDYQRYDWLIGMEEHNTRAMHQIVGSDPDGKIHTLLSFTPRGGDIADPWYTGDFEATWQDVSEGCQAFLDTLRKDGK